VKLVTYGDDNLMNIAESAPDFTHTRLSVALATIGVTYTMADKDAVSVPYIGIDECSFLKRTFKFDPNLECFVGPLENASFDKMLTTYVEKGNIDPRAHSISVISTALREYFFHGKNVFDAKVDLFREVIVESKLEDWVQSSTFPSYENLVYDFWMRSNEPSKALQFGQKPLDTEVFKDYT